MPVTIFRNVIRDEEKKRLEMSSQGSGHLLLCFAKALGSSRRRTLSSTSLPVLEGGSMVYEGQGDSSRYKSYTIIDKTGQLAEPTQRRIDKATRARISSPGSS